MTPEQLRNDEELGTAIVIAVCSVAVIVLVVFLTVVLVMLRGPR